MAEAVGRLLGLYVAPKREVWNIVQREFLQQFLTSFRVDCIFDVGANEGQYAMLARAIGFKGPIISFEPVPRLAASLRNRAASDPNWFIEEIALDEIERMTDFKIMRANQVSSILEPDCELPAYQIVERLSVTTGVIATYFDRYREKLRFSRPFLKTDAQGADLAVIKGAGARLRNFVGLQTELSFARVYRGQDDYRTAIDFCKQNGFELSALFPLGTPLFPRLAEMDCVMFNTRFVDAELTIRT
jgi:FkbM family methyltransferase